MDTNTLSPDFSPYICTKQTELELIAAYIGKDEAQKILTIALQEIGEISPPVVTTTAMIKDPYDYILLAGKLVEKRKGLVNQRKDLDNEFKENLTLLEAKLGEIPVSDRLAAWLSKYKLRTGSDVESVSQIADITTIEKLISSLKSLL
jgi:ribosomal protein L10